MFYVICRLDRNEDGTKGPYVLCRRSEPPFTTRKEAETYAAGINPSREPIVLQAVT